MRAAEDTKPCKVCGEPIKKVARICINCNSYQDWRAEVSVSNTVLSLLVALFSVLTVALPAITTFLTPKNSNLIFSYEGTIGDTISLLVTNVGIRPGAVHYLIIRFADDSSPVRFPFVLTPTVGGTSKENNAMSNTARIVDAGKSELVSLHMMVPFGDAMSKMMGNSKKKCILDLNQTDFLGATSTAPITIDCKLLDQPYGPPPPALPLPDQHR
jgi:hypothetical protein